MSFAYVVDQMTGKASFVLNGTVHLNCSHDFQCPESSVCRNFKYLNLNGTSTMCICSPGFFLWGPGCKQMHPRGASCAGLYYATASLTAIFLLVMVFLYFTRVYLVNATVAEHTRKCLFYIGACCVSGLIYFCTLPFNFLTPERFGIDVLGKKEYPSYYFDTIIFVVFLFLHMFTLNEVSLLWIEIFIASAKLQVSRQSNLYRVFLLGLYVAILVALIAIIASPNGIARYAGIAIIPGQLLVIGFYVWALSHIQVWIKSMSDSSKETTVTTNNKHTSMLDVKQAQYRAEKQYKTFMRMKITSCFILFFEILSFLCVIAYTITDNTPEGFTGNYLVWCSAFSTALSQIVMGTFLLTLVLAQASKQNKNAATLDRESKSSSKDHTAKTGGMWGPRDVSRDNNNVSQIIVVPSTSQ